MSEEFDNKTPGEEPQTEGGYLRRIRKEERGFIIVWCSLIMTVLLGIAGFSVDLGNWYLHIQRAQRAADSAALDGAIHLPADPDTAKAVARAGLINNHVEQRFVDSAVIEVVPGRPNQLYVDVATETTNSFLKFFGLDNTSTFERAATATWAPPLKMGNLSNVLGTEPRDTSRPSNDQWEPATLKSQQRQYWLSIAGRRTFQGRGDEYAAQMCDNPRNNGNIVDGCKDLPNPLNGNSQSYIPGPGGGGTYRKVDRGYDERPPGYDGAQYGYTVTVRQGAPGATTRIQVYDPAFALTGPYCKPPFWRGGNTDDLAAATGSERYESDRQDYCAGDHQYSDHHADDSTVYRMPTTYFRVYDENEQPAAACPGIRTFTPWGPPVGSDYHDHDGLMPFENNAAFRAQYHEWVTLCDIPNNSAQDQTYKIQVWTDNNSEGINHFSLRAGLMTGGIVNPATSGQYIRLSANERLPLYSNTIGSDMRFAIAEVPMSLAGSEVRFSAFDIGDCNNCTLTNSATFMLESDSRSPSSAGQRSTTSCTYTPITNLNNQVNLPNCRLAGVWNGGGYNGKKIKFVWKVPSDYTCGPAINGTSCHLFIRVDFLGGSTQVDDISTWTLDGDGMPLRLIKNPTGMPTVH